jgi:hypothetical protein
VATIEAEVENTHVIHPIGSDPMKTLEKHQNAIHDSEPNREIIPIYQPQISLEE